MDHSVLYGLRPCRCSQDPIDQRLVAIGRGGAIDVGELGSMLNASSHLIGNGLVVPIAKLYPSTGIQAFVSFGCDPGPDPNTGRSIAFEFLGNTIAHALAETQ